MSVDFDNDLFSVSKIGRRSADGRCKKYPSVRGNFGGFHHCEVDSSEKPFGNGLGDMGKMHVHIFNLLEVDLLAQHLTRLIRRPP